MSILPLSLYTTPFENHSGRNVDEYLYNFPSYKMDYLCQLIIKAFLLNGKFLAYIKLTESHEQAVCIWFFDLPQHTYTLLGNDI